MFNSVATFSAASSVRPHTASTLKPLARRKGTRALTMSPVPNTPIPGSILYEHRKNRCLGEGTTLKIQWVLEAAEFQILNSVVLKGKL